MGLDMYLDKKTYVKNWGPKEEQIEITKNGKPIPHIKSERVTYIIEQIGYWRKANAIHKWFVDNVQEGVDDCKHYYVSRDNLRELLDVVNDVLKNPGKAEILLPTQSGFFFGDTSYDEYYFKDLRLTKEICETALAEEECDYFEYNSSW